MGAYVINLDEYKYVGPHWIAFYVNDNNGTITYFDSSGVGHIKEKILKSRQIFVEYKSMIQ